MIIVQTQGSCDFVISLLLFGLCSLNLQTCIHKNYFSYFSSKIYVVGTQNNQWGGSFGHSKQMYQLTDKPCKPFFILTDDSIKTVLAGTTYDSSPYFIRHFDLISVEYSPISSHFETAQQHIIQSSMNQHCENTNFYP